MKTRPHQKQGWLIQKQRAIAAIICIVWKTGNYLFSVA
jgi:hypothetical protein